MIWDVHKEFSSGDEFGYPPVERDEVYIEIFEQAENYKKNSYMLVSTQNEPV